MVTDYLCTNEPLTGPTPIGTALPNHRAYALDQRLRPVPIGVPGQLYIAGTGVTYGYHDRPGLTAQQFLPDPYADTPGQRMYATGDLVRWRADGVLEYLGRRDRQVQLRGQRVELGEIEHTLTQHPDIRQSAVTVRDNAPVGYIVGDADLDDVRRHLADRLPTYMIPTTLVPLPELPLTPNGKLDTARLPEPATPTTTFQPPRTDTERWLADTWQDLLGVDQVNATDNFFDLGGNSLHVTQLMARIRVRFGVALHPHALFADPTLDHLAALVDGTNAGPTGGGAAPVATGVVPLHPRGTRPPLFLVHPSGGSVTSYARLARTIGDDRPVLAIEDPAIRGAEPAGDLAARARLYLELIERVGPDGPYHLGGWSLGGVVALEMARQLADAGAPVGQVVLLDPGLWVGPRPPDDLSVLSAFVHDLAGAAGAAPPAVDPGPLRGLEPEVLEASMLDLLDRAGLVPGGLRAEVRLRMRAFVANVRALQAHRPRPYDGPVVLIRPADSVNTTATTWEALCSQTGAPDRARRPLHDVAATAPGRARYRDTRGPPRAGPGSRRAGCLVRWIHRPEEDRWRHPPACAPS